MKKHLLTALIAGLVYASSFAQQDIMVSQYMFNGLFLNPAYAGTHEDNNVTGIFRKQWVNFEGAPTTQLLSVDGPFKTKNMGLGLQVANDRIGVSSQTDVYGNYAYHLKMGDEGKLSFGLKAGASFYRAELTDLKVWSETDKVFQNNVSTKLMPNFGAGAYYYRNNLYAGFSVPHILAYDPLRRFNNKKEDAFNLVRHYFLTGGYVHKLSDELMIKPSILLKYVENAPLEADFNINMMFKNTFGIGMSYRTGDAIIALVEFQINNRFKVGYAYDFTFTDIDNYSSGSHEIMLSYDFGNNARNRSVPKFF